MYVRVAARGPLWQTVTDLAQGLHATRPLGQVLEVPRPVLVVTPGEAGLGGDPGEVVAHPLALLAQRVQPGASGPFQLGLRKLRLAVREFLVAALCVHRYRLPGPIPMQPARLAGGANSGTRGNTPFTSLLRADNGGLASRSETD